MLKNKAKLRVRALDLAPGDPVIVIAGKDKGKQGQVREMKPKDGRAIVTGINMIKKHQKARSAQAIPLI